MTSLADAEIGSRGYRPQTQVIAWLGIAVLAALAFAAREQWPWIISFPSDWVLPVSAWIDAAMSWFVDNFKFAFRVLSHLLEFPMNGVRAALAWLPWPATLLALVVIGQIAGGARLAIFTGLAMGYVVVFGYWSHSMNTLALVLLSVPLSALIGLFMGIAAFRSKRVEAVVMPLLDVMQTFPSFAYLIPILYLFGFGPVVGLAASTIYAAPPMVRNVILGLRRVPPEIVEAGQMSGATGRQLLWLVRLPSALPTIMVGVNQTTMAAFSMVIIASVVGGSADIGWEVLSTMRKAQFGQSFLAGIVIALMAMVMDRISRGFAERTGTVQSAATIAANHRLVVASAVAILALVLLAPFFPFLQSFPASMAFNPAERMNSGVDYIIANYSGFLDAIKNNVLFYFLLPVRMGFENTVKPFSWGFELTPTTIATYVTVCAVLGVAALQLWGWRAAVGVGILAVLYYYGVTGIPWPVFIATVTLIAGQVGGRRLAIFAFSGLALILLTGFWAPAMRSVYLCAASVLFAFALGLVLGVWAALSDGFSAFIRPVNDTLQTIPLFVFLIPVIMFFQIGDFPAMLAILMYAIVPAIRYTEHGIRSANKETIEAARAQGCTRRQILTQVQLPLALPEIMLGLNQTIVFALAMLVIAALVGTKGLGQAVYVALNAGKVGDGFLAGISMGILAMIADRITQTWSAQKKRDLGLS